MKYDSIGEFFKLIGKTEQTLRNWDKKDILKPHHVTQKDDLERQIETVKTYMYARGYQFEMISDIGSGINYNHKG